MTSYTNEQCKPRITELCMPWIERYENCAKTLHANAESIDWPKKKILGYDVVQPMVGIAPCPLTLLARGVKACADLGYNVITYKTVRSHPQLPHPSPNTGFPFDDSQVSFEQFGKKITASLRPQNNRALATSFGIGCLGLPVMQQELTQALQWMHKDQLLISSVYGTEREGRTAIQDFAYIARGLCDAGAQAIEANLSCPNVKGDIWYLNPKATYSIVKEIVHAVSPIPVVIKVGVFQDVRVMEELFCTAARAGAQGIAGINSVPMRVVDEQDNVFFGERVTAGLSGDPIRQLALDWVRNAVQINEKHRLDLTILAMGGITEPLHIHEFLQEGADVALSAAGAMLNPTLAIEYRSMLNQEWQQKIQHKNI